MSRDAACASASPPSASERHRVALPIEARASALVRTLIANGTTRARSHVDIDNDVGLANLEAVLKVREAFATGSTFSLSPSRKAAS